MFDGICGRVQRLIYKLFCLILVHCFLQRGLSRAHLCPPCCGVGPGVKGARMRAREERSDEAFTPRSRRGSKDAGGKIIRFTGDLNLIQGPGLYTCSRAPVRFVRSRGPGFHAQLNAPSPASEENLECAEVDRGSWRTLCRRASQNKSSRKPGNKVCAWRGKHTRSFSTHPITVGARTKPCGVPSWAGPYTRE